jgi:DNA adenine methylase Dam
MNRTSGGTVFLKSPINYTGGKHKLLPELSQLFPDRVNTFVDLFTGGANVAVNAEAGKVCAYDSSADVIGLYRYLQQHDASAVIERIMRVIGHYQLSDSASMGYDHYGCNSSNGLGLYNKNGYTRLRDDYNAGRLMADKPVLFFVLIVFGFNNQIRHNRQGHFNIPVGKRDFNPKVRGNLTAFITAIQERSIVFAQRDFREVTGDGLGGHDFVYCDPPYLITTASYNEQGGWTEQDEADLLAVLDTLHAGGTRFALSNVMSKEGRTNRLLEEWSGNYFVHEIKRANYQNSNYQKKKAAAPEREVLVTNYATGGTS